MGKPDNLAEIISPGGLLESEIENCGVDHSEDILVSHNIAKTPSTNVDLNAGCGAHIKDEVPIRFEGLNLPGMDGCSRQQVSGVLNWTEALTSTELQLDQSLFPCISSSRHVLQLNEQVVETNSDIHADEMMNIDSFLGSNVSGRYSLGDLQLANYLDKDKEQRKTIMLKLKPLLTYLWFLIQWCK